MKQSTSLPKLPEDPEKPISIQIASTDAWQKGVESVTRGSKTIFSVITKALAENKGALIGRHGTIELTMLLQARQGHLDMSRAEILDRNAGIFPRTESSIRDWIAEYTLATEAADVLAAGWYTPLAKAEWSLLNAVNPTVQRIPLRSLEPYYTSPEHSWTRSLEGQKVCIVSSFTQTMGKQLDYRFQIWGDRWDSLLPVADYSMIRTYYSPLLALGRCEWPPYVTSWRDALDFLEARVLATGSKIVLLGCGGLAMPLARRLKQKGLIAIVLGGAIQVLFGIKGKRWETHPIISGFWNDDWVWPDESEIPGGYQKVEGGCYW